MAVAAKSSPKPRARAGPARTAKRSGHGARPPARAWVLVAGGVLWGLLLAAAVVESSFLTVVVLVPVGVVATASALRGVDPPRRRGRSRSGPARPPVLVAGLGAVVVDPLAALLGPIPAIAALVLSVGLVARLVVPAGYSSSARPLRSVGGQMVAALGPAVAVTSVVVARHQGSSLALTLVAATLAYDAASAVMGHGRTAVGGPVGVLFGALSIAVVALFAAAVMNPPFSGNRPWVVFAGLAVAAPAGVWLSQAVAGAQRLPAVRRLDAWTLAAPFWVLVAALLLNR